ncbi:hypothetical protein NliqN6_3153 [Naganishia liquefaciens]|uniref:AMP-activated protein kinase glycogen-binding domain-containing protein n=1 Tax=Naganishia liquefaciens TaxID=104408 RepID=A0A8H3TTP3_9TREE|nr:hypothetical protein NliqN6_3153 [Naganishia liquefaciens]
MSNSIHHSATFTWPPTRSDRVVVTGTFDDWSGEKHVLERDNETGYFKTQVPIKYGEKVAYKYVVDGQWMTREDEAKEWDAAGNMNNVYTAPHAPKEAEPVASSPQSQPKTLPVSAAAAVPSTTESRKSVDEPSSEKPVAPAPSAAPVGTAPSSAPATDSAVPPSQTATTSTNTSALPTSPSTSDNNHTAESDSTDKKHGLAGLAASAAAAVGIHSKGNHQTSSTRATQPQTGDVPVEATSGHVGQTGDRYVARDAVAAGDEKKESKAEQVVDEVKTKAQTLVASDVPGSSTSSRGVEADAGVQHASTGLAGLNLGAPIGAAATVYSPAHTTTITTSSGTGISSSGLTADKHTTETAVAPKSEGPKTEIPQPAVPVTTSSETAVAAKTEAPKATSVPQPAVVVPGAAPSTTSKVPLNAKAVSDETAVAPVDAGPKTSIPQPAVDGVSAQAPAQDPAAAKTLLADVPAPSSIEDTVTEQVEKITHTAQQVGTQAAAAITSLASGLVIGLGDAVHNVTGVDVLHSDPVSLGSPAPKVLAEMEEGRGGDVTTAAAGEKRLSAANVAAMAPFESQLKRSPRLAQTGFPLPPPGPAALTTARPAVHRAPSSSASLYKSEAQELRRRSWNLNNDQQSQMTLDEAKRAGINTSALPVLEGGPASAKSAEALANTLTAPIPIAKDTAAMSTSSTTAGSRDLSGQAGNAVRNLNTAAPAVPEKSNVPVSFKSSAPAVQPTVPVASVTTIPLPPAKDGLPAPRDEADIQATRSIPQFSATAPRASAPVNGSNAGSAPSSGAANVRATTNAATASSPSEPKHPDVFSSNKEDKPVVPAGEKKAEYKTDLPGQAETKNTNHKSVPMPVITSVGSKDKDRTQPSHADNADQQVSSNPAVGTHQVKEQAHAEMKQDVEGVPSRSYAKQPVPGAAVTGLPLATTQKPLDQLPAAAPAAAPATPVKPAAAAAGPVAADTPASRVGASPAVAASPATPASGTDSGKKKKSGFLSKVKSVFHKDKTPK